MANTSTRITFSWATLAAWIGAAIAAWLWRDELIALVEHANQATMLMRVFTYSVVYVTLAGLNVPGAVLLTLLAGPLFGTTLGTLVASFVSTLGALLAFLLNRHFLSTFSLHAGGILTASRNFSKNMHWPGWSPTKIGAYELLLLRIVPVVPFCVVNVLAGRSRMSPATFWLVSQLGMLPATVLLVFSGAALTKL